MTDVQLASQITRTVGEQRIYIRQTWQADWTLVNYLHCSEATWCLSPSIPTATLDYLYGWVQLEGNIGWSSYAKKEVNGWYVKIEFDYDPVQLTERIWYGVITHTEDENEGIVSVGGSPKATGRQVFHCYGLERLLDIEHISESVVDTSQVAVLYTPLPVTFNKDGKPNRNDRELAPGNAYCFDGGVFIPTGAPRDWWTTTDIVRYLLNWQSPKDSYRTRNIRIKFRLYDPQGLLPREDKPVLQQEGSTVLGLLHQLIDRRRLRSFYLDVDETETPNAIRLRPVAWNAQQITSDIEDFETLKENTETINLDYDYSQCTTSLLRKSVVTKYDRIVVRGARRTSTVSMWVDANLLDIGWTAAEEEAYEDGATNEAGYAALDYMTQIQRNAEVRGSQELTRVYSWFAIPDDWDLLTRDPATDSTSRAFIDAAGNSVKQYVEELAIESFLPLYEGVDYSTCAIPDFSTNRIYRPPYVAFKVPISERYVSGDAIASLSETVIDEETPGTPEVPSDNLRWSAMARGVNESRIVEVRVSGEPQHVIAATDYTATAEDRLLGAFDYQSKGMIVTFAIRENRYAEGVYPSDPDAGSGTLTDQLYSLVLYAGESFRQDYLVPSTVLDTAADGTLVKTDGGYVRDDTARLSALARIAFEWWNQDRVILSLNTTDLNPYLRPGVMIAKVGNATVVGNGHYETVNTVITESRITWPRLDQGGRDMPLLRIVTGAGELDPMTLNPPIREKTARSWRAWRRMR